MIDIIQFRLEDLNDKQMKQLVKIESQAFIPPIQTTEKVIRRRLNQRHIYLGVHVNFDLVGTLALRFAKFNPDFQDFTKSNPTFSEYAERENEEDPNSAFVYSIGVIPSKRNGFNASELLKSARDIAKQRNLDFLVGDARIPSYNGSYEYLDYEQFEKNWELHEAINNYLASGELPPRRLIEQDPVAGFYLKVFPKGKLLGITDDKFWPGDYPCGGHMAIEYLELK